MFLFVGVSVGEFAKGLEGEVGARFHEGRFLIGIAYPPWERVTNLHELRYFTCIL